MRLEHEGALSLPDDHTDASPIRTQRAIAVNCRIGQICVNRVMSTATSLPSLFVSHGSPMIALEPGAAGAAMQQIGHAWLDRFGRPQAIVTVSAHTGARIPVLLAGARHEAVYDFGNFDPRLFTLRYDAPGAPSLAREVHALLDGAGLAVQVVDQAGLDHGAWTALRYLFPQADIPILPLAFVPSDSPQRQFELGRALAPLRNKNVLLLGSGSITHNLGRVFAGGIRANPDRPEIPESAAFRDWFVRHSADRNWPALFDYRRQAPHAVDMHPTDEHLLPWFVAAGAGGTDAAPLRLHDSVTYGSLGMDAYAFGTEAAGLAEAMAG